MKKNCLQKVCSTLFLLVFLVIPYAMNAQQTPQEPTPPTNGQDTAAPPKSMFWSRVQWGGGLGLGFGSGFANVAVLPSAIYNVNQYFAVGLGVQYNYLKQRDFYESHLYGGSIIGFFNPIEGVQLSLELEELRANVKAVGFYESDDFWNTGLFLGAGYHMDNVTVGVRYNVLFVADKGVYGDAMMPFVRAYF